MYPNQIAVLRDALASLDEVGEDLEGLKASIAEWKAGDPGLPIDAAFAMVRREMAESPSPCNWK